MSQPLGEAAGNALEVRESVELLRGKGPPDVRSLTLDLAARMITLAGAARDDAEARAAATRALDDGAAWERFLEMVAAQGGDRRCLEQDGLPRAPHVLPARAARTGRVRAVRTFELGELVVHLGGGRRAKEDRVDPAVGLRVLRRIGDDVRTGDVVAEVHAGADEPGLADRVAACFEIGDEPVTPPPLVLERIE
jgi:thymidine phosphorylase